MTSSRIERLAYACALSAAGLAVVFLWAVEFGPKAVVNWWTQTPAVAS